jgi:hypothetical protein
VQPGQDPAAALGADRSAHQKRAEKGDEATREDDRGEDDGEAAVHHRLNCIPGASAKERRERARATSARDD